MVSCCLFSYTVIGTAAIITTTIATTDVFQVLLSLLNFLESLNLARNSLQL